MQWTKDDKERLKGLLHSGKTYTQASTIMGRSRGSIAAFVSKHKVYFSSGSVAKSPPIVFPVPKPSPDNTIIERPPREVPVPEGCKHIPFIEIEHGQCRYMMTDFWEEPMHTSPCCGLPVHDPTAKTRARTHCTHHYQWSIENEDEENSC